MRSIWLRCGGRNYRDRALHDRSNLNVKLVVCAVSLAETKRHPADAVSRPASASAIST